MGDWGDYIGEKYEEYMAENCTCAKSDCECPCMSFEKFSEEHLHDLQSYWDNYPYDEAEVLTNELCHF